MNDCISRIESLPRSFERLFIVYLLKVCLPSDHRSYLCQCRAIIYAAIDRSVDQAFDQAFDHAFDHAFDRGGSTFLQVA